MIRRPTSLLAALLALLAIAGIYRLSPSSADDRTPANAGHRILRGHTRLISSVAFSPDGTLLASASEDDTIKLWHVDTGREALSLSVPNQGPSTLAFSPDGKHIAVGNWQATIDLFEVSSGKKSRTFTGHRENITTLAFSPDGKHIATGSGDDTLKVWETATGKQLFSMDLENEYDFTAVAYTPDGKRIIAGDGEGNVSLLNARNGATLLSLTSHELSITAVACGPDGKRIVSASRDQTIRVWDSSGDELLTLRGHVGDVTSIAIRSDGKQIASASDDKTIKIWDLATGNELASHEYDDRVSSIAFSPGGQLLALASGNAVFIRGTAKEMSQATQASHTSSIALGEESYKKSIAPFLKRHCVSCHGPQRQESRIRFDSIDKIDASNRNLWTLVHAKISTSEMPPRSRPQPTDPEKTQFLAAIRNSQRSLGINGTRRLNRRELSAALKDVTGVDIDFSSALPGDGTVAGFDTGANGLQEASDAVVQWLLVTRRAVEGIRFLDPAPTVKFTADLRAAKDARKELDAWKNSGATIRGSGRSAAGRRGEGLILEPRAVGERDSLTISIPPRADRQGILRLTLVVSAWKPIKGLPNPRLWVRIGGKDLDYCEITGTLDQPQRLVYQAHLGDLAIQTRGVSIDLKNRVEIPYAVAGFENDDRSNPKDPVPGGTGLFRPSFDRRKLPQEKQPVPFIVLQKIEVEPDVVSIWPPASWNANLKVADNAACAQKLLALWMDRAWRRPTSDKEQERFLKLYEKLRADGFSFDNALRGSFQAVLVSVPFRYQASPGDPDTNLAQHALASRISFMLLGEPADAELRKLAAAGKLEDQAVLDTQVDRLLASPRSQGFFRPFIRQWLEMDQPITIAQDHIQKQDFRFARYLKESMREETIAYITALFTDNRPAGELVHSDWTMMNDILAYHYGYKAIDGGELRKVKLRSDDPRQGGILGHAGLQSMLCWMGDNWVIYRGAWTLRHILDQPPPPPPLEVPELNPSDGKNRGKSFRELLKQHQLDNRCAVCHKTIDPVGFAFQNFDISGRWRDFEHERYARSELDGRVAWHGAGKTRPVDAAGQLPRGEAFKTFAEFKQVIVKNYQDDLVRGLLKNLMLYGTGRLPGIDDMDEIETIIKQRRPQGYPLRNVLKAVVKSRAFRERYQLPNQSTIGRRPE